MAQSQDVANWNDFFLQWKAAKMPDVRQWEHFFISFSDLMESEKSPVPKAEFTKSIEECAAFFEEFGAGLKAYRQSGKAVDIWKLAGIGTNEMRNSQVLAWMLDCNADHGQGSLFLEKFLDIAKTASEKQTGFQKSVPFPEWVEGTQYKTRTEQTCGTNGDSRVDIEIEGPHFLIFIEVKIYAQENGNQLERYVEVARKKACGRPWGVIYLTRRGERPKDEMLNDNIISLRWNDLSKGFKHSLESATVNGLGLDSLAYHAIDQFSGHINSF